MLRLYMFNMETGSFTGCDADANVCNERLDVLCVKDSTLYIYTSKRPSYVLSLFEEYLTRNSDMFVLYQLQKISSALRVCA